MDKETETQKKSHGGLVVDPRFDTLSVSISKVTTLNGFLCCCPARGISKIFLVLFPLVSEYFPQPISPKYLKSQFYIFQENLCSKYHT